MVDRARRPKGLIVRASARGTPTPKRTFDSDIADYSFDRAVICDRARTADLLIANNFHFENNCAVLSVDGYPEPLFDTVRAMLKRNPKLHVFALHDSSPAGCRLAHRLRTNPEWFAGQGKVTDVGLRPSQAGASTGSSCAQAQRFPQAPASRRSKPAGSPKIRSSSRSCARSRS
jgi:hypothetical protein